MACAFALAAAAAVSQTAFPQRMVDVSDDGRITVTRSSHQPKEEGGLAGGAPHDVPYAAVPDWQNTLRLQIGGVRVGDFNNDGLNDIVIGTYISNSFPPYTDFHTYIYFNTGSGLEAEPSWMSTDTVHTTDIQIGDINGDGYLDIFCANGGGAFSPSIIYFGTATVPNNSPGWFSTVSPATWAVGATLFDFDHDGDLDVITANQGVSPNPFRPTYIFINNGGVLSTSPIALSAELSMQNSVAFADFDQDGWEDLAISKWTNGFQSGVHRNIGGVLQSTQFWTRGVSATDKGVAWADVNGDGWVDLAIGCAGGTQVFLNNRGALASAWTAQPPFNGVQEIAFADVNGDGWPDLAETHFSDGRTHIYLNRNGTLDTQPTWTYDAVPLGSALDFGDINGDGRPDLVIGYSGQPSVVVFYAIPPLCEADLTGDGTVDVSDLLTVIGNWGACVSPPNCPGDVNGDETVNVSDLLAVIGAWGACP